jgi:hypothetical protein
MGRSQTQGEEYMTIRIYFSDTTVRVAVEINGAIESKVVELPQRTWVGLTQDERINIAHKANGNEVVSVELTEAKLKEKNT